MLYIELGLILGPDRAWKAVNLYNSLHIVSKRKTLSQRYPHLGPSGTISTEVLHAIIRHQIANAIPITEHKDWGLNASF